MNKETENNTDNTMLEGLIKDLTSIPIGVSLHLGGDVYPKLGATLHTAAQTLRLMKHIQDGADEIIRIQSDALRFWKVAAWSMFTLLCLAVAALWYLTNQSS